MSYTLDDLNAAVNQDNEANGVQDHDNFELPAATTGGGNTIWGTVA